MSTPDQSTCDLTKIFGDLAASVPDGPPGYPNFVFHAGMVPAPPITLHTDRIIIRKMMHEYDSCYRAEQLWMYLNARKCRELAVFLLACAFHGPPRNTTLVLTHPKSDIRRITVAAGQLSLADLPVGISWVPFALNYFPMETEKHPWLDECYPQDLPLLALSNEEDCVVGEEQWKSRDTVWVQGSSAGTIRLAELLLNAGCPWNGVREYQLEGDAGFRGVAPMSAELRIWLPGSDAWLGDGDDVPMVNGAG